MPPEQQVLFANKLDEKISSTISKILEAACQVNRLSSEPAYNEKGTLYG